MQAAFVDIGLDKAGFFMHLTSCRTPNVWRVKNKAIHGARHLGTGPSGARSDGAVVKDPLGTKGARLTTDITLLLAIWCLCQGLLTLGYPNELKRIRT